MRLADYRDIHTHNLDAGSDSIINLPWSQAAAMLEAPSSDRHYSIGIHPWDTAATTQADLEQLATLATHPRVVAIGETGLDALRGASLDRQEEVFAEHVRVSERVGKPLIIHAVRTLSDIMRLRRKLRPKQQWVLHGFRGKPQTARQLIDMGIDISLGTKHHPDMPGDIDPRHIYHETDEGRG